MIKASIDRPRLERNLRRLAKEFGEISAQAVVRWSVQACRELAMETQAFGKSGTKKIQEGAIIGDAYNVLLVVDRLDRAGKGFSAHNQGKSYYVSASKVLNASKQANDWIEINRTRRRGRTAKLPPQERKVIDRKTFNQAMKARFKRAGMAKGGWLGAGMDIAKAQKGQDRINIGKNFLSYAQKHSSYGSATRPSEGWSPFVNISNRVAHSASKNVLSNSSVKKAVDWSLKKTVTWYRSALRKQDQKQKP